MQIWYSSHALSMNSYHIYYISRDGRWETNLYYLTGVRTHEVILKCPVLTQQQREGYANLYQSGLHFFSIEWSFDSFKYRLCLIMLYYMQLTFIIQYVYAIGAINVVLSVRSGSTGLIYCLFLLIACIGYVIWTSVGEWLLYHRIWFHI